MPKIVYGKGFLKDAKKLSEKQREKLAELLEILRDDPFDPRLHTKPLSGELKGRFSFRITRDWRVGFRFIDTDTIFLLIVERRDKIYKKMKKK